MVDVQPMRGLRYVGERVGDPAQVLAPPYDIISPQEQLHYYNRSPYNVIRLEFGQEESTDTPVNNRYTRAKETLTQWRTIGILNQERTACYYLYRQIFSLNAHTYTRTSLFARVRLEPFSSRMILPHEQTMSKPLDDRLKLLRATRTNISPIMSLYRDPQGLIRKLFSHVASSTPVQIIDERHEGHMLYSITDPAQEEIIQNFFTPLRLYIADGHHRYETALNYREEVQEQHKKRNAENTVNFVMMALIDIDDPGLVILPTHRIVTHLEPKALQTLSRQNVEGYFDIREIERGISADMMMSMLAQSGERQPSLVLMTKTYTWLLALNERGKARMAESGHSPAWNNLEVAVAQTLLLQEFLGLGSDAMIAGEHVRYTHDAQQVLQSVSSDEGQVGILLNATPVQQLCEVVDAGELLPQKTTYFYPKLPTGLVMNPLE